MKPHRYMWITFSLVLLAVTLVQAEVNYQHRHLLLMAVNLATTGVVLSSLYIWVVRIR